MRRKQSSIRPLAASDHRIGWPSCLAVLLGTILIAALTACTPSPPSHGAEFVVEINPGTNLTIAGTNQLHDTAAALRNRIQDSLGLAVFIEPTPPTRLLLKVRELTPDERIAMCGLITNRALIEFCMVHPKSAELIEQGVVPPDYRLLNEERNTRNGSNKTTTPWLVRTTPERELTSMFIQQAIVMRQQIAGEPEISFSFNPEGARLFQEVTTEFSPRGQQVFYLAIVLDGKIKAAPRINAPISGGRAALSGSFTLKEAATLAILLSHPMPARCEIVEEKSF